jgi:Leucine-rich repeat (LRR) protein
VTLEFNNLRSLPSSLEQMNGLMELDVRGNFLTDLPPFNGLLSLRKLDFATNAITAFPESILEVPTLEELSISYNAITHIPREIADMPSLKVVRWEGNPLDKQSRNLMQTAFPQPSKRTP